MKAPSTLGTFLGSFRWGHVRQLDRVSRELLARAWAAGAGPGDVLMARAWAAGAGPGDVLMARLREGRANTVRGAAAHFLRETVGRVRYGWGHRTTHGARRQRLLHPRHRRRLPRDGCALLHHRPPARPPAQYHRGHTRD